ncbi:hypothetical protein ACQ858_13645 [Variovorax ureilyticus]|uniref:hypothetical protein n=1 Tax=Variovorax ureilyticus TaxID=1836198 RepID=UPI003D67955A
MAPTSKSRAPSSKAAPPAAGDVRLVVVIDKPRHNKLKVHAAKAGKTIKEVITEYIDQLGD